MALGSGEAAGRAWDAPRVAIAAIFLLDGLTFGLWVAHLPLIKGGLHLTDLAFASALAGMVGGAFVAQPLAGALATRAGSRRVTRVASVVACLALGVPAFAPSLPLLIASTALLGFTRGATEVPMNAQATLLEARDARPRMSSFHGCFSLGGFLGSALAALLLRHGDTPRVTLPAAGVACAVISAVVSRSLLRETPAALHTTAERAARPSLATLARDRTLLALGALAFCGLFGEGAMSDWSALLLQRTTGVAPAAAALGYAAFSIAMTLGRFSGDMVIARLGRGRTLRASGLVAAAGLTVALVSPYVAAVLGFAAVGLGYANLVPILFSASGRRAGSAGIAAVSTLGYFGFVIGPPTIGGLSTLLGSLPLALGVVAAFALLIALGAGAANAPAAPAARAA
ncbi:MFS transporter [Gemmatimonadetes bacterium T265]|nr:MFS transporter [Gemmatimonadetes bacterium T265]